MYESIILDLDGTLLDTSSGVIYAVNDTIKQLRLKRPDENVLKKFVGPPMQLSFEKNYGMESRDALTAANLFRKIYKEKYLYMAELYPEVLETLDVLKGRGYKLAVATNKSHDNAMSILKHFHIADYCDYMEGSDLQGVMKKSDIIMHCCLNLNTKPERCIYVGDSEFDLEGATICGISFIAALYGFGFKEEVTRNNLVVKNISAFSELKDFNM